MILLDTNILARSIQLGNRHQKPATFSIAQLHQQGKGPFVVSPQVLTEFYAAATRSSEGLKLSPEEALAETASIKQRSAYTPKTPKFSQISNFFSLNTNPRTAAFFDTRHVAFMMVHKIPSILTFNDKDFSIYSEIQVLNPFEVLNIPRA